MGYSVNELVTLGEVIDQCYFSNLVLEKHRARCAVEGAPISLMAYLCCEMCEMVLLTMSSEFSIEVEKC